MSWFEKYTAYQPTQTTTTTSWGGWKPMSSRCPKCVHYTLVSGLIPACYCVSRTVKHGAHGDECVSYREVVE